MQNPFITRITQTSKLPLTRKIIAAAPMAGVSDLPFREIAERFGADFSVSEMLASRQDLIASGKSQSRLQFFKDCKIKIVQLLGNHPKDMAYAAQYYADQGAEIIDINLGCPAKKVENKGAGAALLDDLPYTEQILAAVVAASPVPVTLKTRLGPAPGHYTLLAIGEMASRLGITSMTVHARTRACRFVGQTDFSEIKRLKACFPDLCVLANGDIDSVERAKQVLAETGCDGVMIGRASMGNPWLFQALRQAFDSSSVFSPITEAEKRATIQSHLQALYQFYGEHTGVRMARKHIRAYFDYFQKADAFAKVSQITTATEQLEAVMQIL